MDTSPLIVNSGSSTTHQDETRKEAVWPWLLLVLALGCFLRFYMVGEWSLWTDEGTSIYFSQHPTKPFPSYFPLYFRILGGLYALTGITVFTGRVLSACLGVASIGVAFLILKGLIKTRAACWAVCLMSVNFGHLFWSQSIRYYILLLLLQLVSIYFFFQGCERQRRSFLVLSNVFLLLGVLTHLSGALLFPVYVGYLGLTWLAGRPMRYPLRVYLWFGVPFLAVSVFFLWQYLEFRESLAYLVTSSEGVSLPGLLIRIAVYQGLPALILSGVGIWLGWGRLQTRLLLFLGLIAFLPLAELMVMASQNMVIVLWYQAFFMVFGLNALAGYGISEIGARCRTWMQVCVIALCVAFYTPLLLGYFTTMYGDRPRWKDAADAIKEQVIGNSPRHFVRPVYATVPVVVAFYLGVPPAETQYQRDVLPFSVDLGQAGPSNAFYLVERSVLSSAHLRWLQQHCSLVAEFPAHSGPKDRTVSIYEGCR